MNYFQILTYDFLIQKLNEQKTYQEIADEIGCCQETVWSAIKRVGLFKGVTSKKILPEKEIIKLYVEDKNSITQIAKIFNVSKTPVKRCLKKYNIKLRNTSESKKALYVSSPEFRKTMSECQKGRKMSNVTKQKMSESHKGHKKSEEWKEKLRQSNILAKRGKRKRKDNSLPCAIRTLSEYKWWRLCVYKRDQFRCQICFKQGFSLNADHIKPFSVILKEYNIKTIDEAVNCKELWDTTNGRTLCVECHKKTDTYGLGALNYESV